jgi:hypothetical protein
MKTITSQVTRAWLGEYFRRRRDFGLWKAVVNIALDPPNPFKPGARRLPKAEFLFGVSLLTFAIAWSLYFNFVR